MKTPKKKPALKRRSSPPKLVNTTELCKELVIMAAFAGNTRVEEKIYKAVRQLQLLDKLADDAGLLRS